MKLSIKAISGLVVLFVIFLYLIVGKPKHPTNITAQMVEQSQFAAETITMPESTIRYLRNSHLYSKFFNEGKNFVVYCNGDKCPYVASFNAAIEKIVLNPDYQEQYNFVALPNGSKPEFDSEQEKNEDNAFFQICHEFCIVNPFRGELFYISNVGEEDASEIEHIFAGLKGW